MEINSDSWKKLIDENYDDIRNAILDINWSLRNENSDHGIGIGIEPTGNVFTWEFVGNYSCPETIWNGTDMELAVLRGYSYTDIIDDSIERYIRETLSLDTNKKMKYVISELENYDGNWLDYLKYTHPIIFDVIEYNLYCSCFDVLVAETDSIMDGIHKNF